MTGFSRRALLALTAALPLIATSAARAQAFPDRPIRLVVPYAAGGTADALARAVAEHMRKALGQPVLVDNKPGGNTAVGAQIVAAAAPDGHTLLMGTGSTMVTNPLMSAKLSYNAGDLAPVARLAVAPLVVEVHPAVPAQTFAEFVRHTRAQPGKLNFASTGSGSVVHLASLLIESQAGLEITHVPYNGSAPALAAVLGGEVQLFLDSIGSSLPLIKAGRLRALAVTTPERLKVLPDVPTVAESGFPGFDASAWYGVLVPARTPPEVVARLNAAIGSALVDKGFREQFETTGLVVAAPASVAEFAERLRREHERWAPLIRAKKLTLE
ncbi:MAG TPA: tripartite tricarboxylate transporter substrate binding protein [Ramlibacter sp.]|nr:tripartite tricarboxylate transporter substrate binding protein [Ramlibacter sp.]